MEIEVGQEARTSDVLLAARLDPVRPWAQLVYPDTEGRRFLTRDGGVRLRDGPTGALLATLVETVAPVSASFVADGRIVVGEAVGAQTRVHVFSGDGTPLREATLDHVPMMLGVGPEVAPGRMAVHFFAPYSFGETLTLVFDLGDGRVVQTLREMRPVRRFLSLGSPGRAGGAGASTVHFFTKGGVVERLDFATGERRVVAGPGAPAGQRLVP